MVDSTAFVYHNCMDTLDTLERIEKILELAKKARINKSQVTAFHPDRAFDRRSRNLFIDTILTCQGTINTLAQIEANVAAKRMNDYVAKMHVKETKVPVESRSSSPLPPKPGFFWTESQTVTQTAAPMKSEPKPTAMNIFGVATT